MNQIYKEQNLTRVILCYVKESVGQTAEWICYKWRQHRERRHRFAVDNIEFHVSYPYGCI